MENYFTLLWRRLSAKDSKGKAEIEQIGALQQAAANRRAEYAEMKAQTALTGEALDDLLAPSRKRMEDAEAAHTAALQAWENKQSRQKSR